MKYILTADNHFQYNQPICRTDDFITAQIDKLKFLKTLQQEHNAIILNSGDITHKARVDKQELFSLLLSNMPEMYGVAGNHDLMYHSLNYLYNSAIGVLIHAGKYKFIKKETPLSFDEDVVYGFSYGQKIEHPHIKGKNKTIAIWHNMIYTPQSTLNFTRGYHAETILQNYPEYDYILTGDNHQTFDLTLENRTLINPGSLTRDDAAQIDHKPCVYLLDTSANTLKKVFVPVRKGVITTEHLDVKKDRDKRLEAFIEVVNNDYEIGFVFEENLKEYLYSNPVNDDIKKIIYECTGI